MPPRTAGVVQRFEEERGERIEVHLEWRRKGHEVMGELEDVIEEVIRTAIFNNQTRKRARVELKALRRLRECEEHEEMRERAHREEGTKRVRKAAHSAGEAEEEWASALQGQTDTTQVDGCLPRRVQMHQRMQQTGRAQATAGCTPWESVEEREQDTVDMGQLLEEDGSDFLLQQPVLGNDTEEPAGYGGRSLRTE